jgi:hypothetical protein
MKTIGGVLCAAVVVFGACGGSPAPVEGPGASEHEAPAGSSTSAPADAAHPPAPAASAEPAASGGHESEAEALARDLIKMGGRRIGWSSSKKGFAHPQKRRSGESSSLDVVFTDQEGRPKDVMRICQAGECDEHLTELAKQAMPKLASRLEAEGYVGVRAIGWPQGHDDLDVGPLGMKLKLTGGTLQGSHEGKPAVRIGAVKPKLMAIFVVPDTKLLGVITSPDGEVWNETFSVLKLP